MARSRTSFRRNWLIFMTSLFVGILIGCQGGLAPLSPLVLATPTLRGTSTPRTALRDAPAPLSITVLPPVDDETLRLFDYDPLAPIGIQEDSVTEMNGYLRYEITYASPKGGWVPATLLVPTGSSGPFAGIILMHGLPGDRTNNATFARGLVATGAVLLMIDAPFARPENRDRSSWPLTFSEVDRLEQIQLMIDLRRGVDLLIAREDVDPERLAFVGYSYGAAIGGLLAGIEPRLKAFGSW